MRSFVVAGSAGCFLLVLILGNFLFGWLIFKPLTWILIEVFLCVCFRWYAFITGKKIQSGYFKKRNGKFIDVEGKVLDEDE